MRQDQENLIKFALTVNALQFGDFILKSGRSSPYFFNTGQFNTGTGLMQLGQAYAHSINASKIKFDMLYGPAYKGIPLVAATAIAFAAQHHRDLLYAFNRKEIKDHGEGGQIVGSPLQGRVFILDDVISAGTSVRESIAILKGNGATPVGIAIALDRQEQVLDLRFESTLPIISILKLEDIIEYLEKLPFYAEDLQRLHAYQALYGTITQTHNAI